MSGPRVLLIDDEEELVTTLVERLEIRGIEAEAVTDGHAALELMSREPFDVVAADLKMPGLGGLEVIEILRERYPDVKILLITGHGRPDEEVKDYKVAGVHEVLVKPFSIDTLIASIRGALAANT
ncbi:MAG: Transcriptional regulatory protein tctD [Calditrichaeota bacterium]|nr:Transcriptional regulatory protein tctD [Calditrichota bacterium]